MKKLTFLLAVLLAVTSLNLVAFAQGADKSPNPTPKTTTTQTATKDAAVTANVKPVKSYTAVVGKTYKLPDVVKKTGDTYATSNSAVLTVEKETGRFKAITNGTAYIVTTKGTSTRYIKVTVGTGKSTTTSTGSGKSALTGYSVTVLDKTTPAVNFQRVSTGGGRYQFRDASGTILGYISEDNGIDIVNKALNSGVTTSDFEVNSHWLANEFNKHRGLGLADRVIAKEEKVDTVSLENEIVRLVNEARRNEGLNELTVDSSMTSLARVRASEVRGNYSHVRPDGTRLSQTYKYGENVSSKQGSDMTARIIVDSWLNSPGHRANILHPDYLYIGVGVVEENSIATSVQLFSW